MVLADGLAAHRRASRPIDSNRSKKAAGFAGIPRPVEWSSNCDSAQRIARQVGV